LIICQYLIYTQGIVVIIVTYFSILYRPTEGWDYIALDTTSMAQRKSSWTSVSSVYKS